MELIKMKYKNYSFDINPSSIKLEHSKNIICQSVLDNFDKTIMMSVKPTIIVGSGIIAGTDMLEKLSLLQVVFASKTSSYLFLPGLTPIKAYFSNIKFKISSDKNSISYDFEFVEDNQCKKEYYNFGYTIAKKSENLYDIANRLDVSVERLVEHNDFEDLFDVKEGDIVRYD